jgi:glycosyltransferase involved in cell wall biosynthesis
LRIAHFVQRYPPALGGSEAYFQRLSRHLVSRGHDVSVWTTNALDLEAFWSVRGRTLPDGDSDDDGVAVRRFRCRRWPLRRYMLKALSLLPGATWKAMTMRCNPIAVSMWRAADQATERIDIVHATAFPYAWPVLCARRLARRTNAKFFITPFLHLGSPDVPSDLTRKQYLAPPLRALLHSADGIFVQTPCERDAVRELGIADDRIILQGMGVDPAECSGGDGVSARRGWAIADDDVVVGHLANLSYEKGTVDLLLAAQEAWKLGAKFRIVLAGPSMLNFRRLWLMYPDKQRVTLAGELSDQQKRDFFAAIDVFALPSKSDSFGLVLLEAWCNGKPNIAYRCGGIADVIRHQQDGLLVNCGPSDRVVLHNIKDFALELTRLVNDEPLRKRLGEEGRKRALREMKWQEKLGIVEQAYQRLTTTIAHSPHAAAKNTTPANTKQ